MVNLEQVIINKIRNLSVEKQEDVLEFLDLIEENFSEQSTSDEKKKIFPSLNDFRNSINLQGMSMSQEILQQREDERY